MDEKEVGLEVGEYKLSPDIVWL